MDKFPQYNPHLNFIIVKINCLSDSVNPQVNSECKLMDSPVIHDGSGFEKLMLEAIDESLSSLGDKSKDLIYFHLEQNLSIDRANLPTNIEAFANALEEIFGNGAKFLEFLIMKKFNQKIGCIFKLEEDETSFYVTAATDFSKKIIELLALEKDL